MTLERETAARWVFALMAGIHLAGSLKAQPPMPVSATGIVFAADVPLVELNGVPCVEVRIGDGSPVLFGVDTGNVNTLIDTKIAKSAGLALEGLPPPAPAGFYLTSIPPIHIGPVMIGGRRGVALDFSANQLPAGIAGTLAYTVFKDRIVQMDFAAGRLRISDILTGPVSIPGPRDSLSLIRFGRNGPPIVVAQGFELEGKPVSAQVDTMYTGSLLVYTASIEKLSLSGAAQTTDVRLFPLTDGGVNMRVAEAQQESFNGLILAKDGAKVYFPTETVHEPEGLFDATVGLELFHDAVLTLNFHDMTIAVAKNGQAS